MTKRQERQQTPIEKPKQLWGPMIRDIRLSKEWSQARLYKRYCILAGQWFGEREDVDDEVYDIDDLWLRRAEKGTRVRQNRERIELLIEAVGADVLQKWNILSAAGYNCFTDINGQIDPVDQVYQRVFTQLLSSKRARKAIQRKLIKNPATADELQLLLEAIQAAIEERKSAAKGKDDNPYVAGALLAT